MSATIRNRITSMSSPQVRYSWSISSQYKILVSLHKNVAFGSSRPSVDLGHKTWAKKKPRWLAGALGRITKYFCSGLRLNPELIQHKQQLFPVSESGR